MFFNEADLHESNFVFAVETLNETTKCSDFVSLKQIAVVNQHLKYYLTTSNKKKHKVITAVVKSPFMNNAKFITAFMEQALK